MQIREKKTGVICYSLYGEKPKTHPCPFFYTFVCLRTRAGAGAFFPGFSHKKIPQEDAVTADRAFFPGALSVKVTSAKAQGCGHFSVKNREGRRKSPGA